MTRVPMVFALVLVAGFAAIVALTVVLTRTPAPNVTHLALTQRDVRLLILQHLDDRRLHCSGRVVHDGRELLCNGLSAHPVPYPEFVVPCLRQVDELACDMVAAWDGRSVIGALEAPRLCVRAVGGAAAFTRAEFDLLQGDSL